MDSKHTSSVVRKVAFKMRAAALGLSDGDLLGSEDELIERYQVSRPTLRLAANTLVQEQLLRVRRGVGGGYFARVPTTEGVSHAAIGYLLAHGSTMQEIIIAVAPIKVELATLAAGNRDPNLRVELEQFAAMALPSDDELYWTFLRSERTFSKILIDMARNRVLGLFLNIVYDMCAQVPPEKDVYRNNPSRIREYWECRNGMVKAILSHDADVAAVFARRCALMVAGWMSKDIDRKAAPNAYRRRLSITNLQLGDGSGRQVSGRPEKEQSRPQRVLKRGERE